ncbi:MAG TPA: dienelactone hydrolase family protein [Thermoanaerobaculia bacterium]|nr:dienelactone hydrolase family protein [Thermoanaerobaculia bacterium]
MRRSSLILLLAVALVSCAKHEATEGAEHADHTATAASSATTSSNTSSAPATAAAALANTQYGNGASGYLAAPTDAGKHPAIIVIHEWWGLDDWIRQQADRFRDQGYVVLAVDLYRGHAAKSPEEAHELMRGLPEDRALADMKAAFDFLAARPDVDPQHIGVIGWCMGGGYALALTTNEPRLAASSINYGRLVTDENTIAKIKAPILGNFGGKDRGIAPADVKAFDAALKKQGKTADIKIYDNSGHAFMNPNNKEGYVAADANDAQARIDRFFGQTLRAKIPNS